ncbi:MAG: thiamine pyrophosphate-dependent enzyme, partial [Gaiellaceae bacterium]
AKAVLDALASRLRGPPREDGPARAAAARSDGSETERGLLHTIRQALPSDAVTSWDMTILAYWAAAHFPVYEPRTFHYPLGSGTLGYAWPAALGASLAASGRRVLAVAGDGGFNYGIAELAAARQYELDAKLLLVDDGGYGILREYQRDQFGETTSVDLVQPDFRALVEAFGVPVVSVQPEGLAEALAAAFAEEGPSVVHVPALLEMWT